jgi:TolA-binding protein
MSMRHLLIAALLTTSLATPVMAQDSDVERRVDRIEREVRALQRRVFPGGSPEFFEPEIQPGTQTGPAGSPAGSPITDLTDRVNSLERQLATLTGQVEENSYELRQLRTMIEALQGGGTAAPALDVETPVAGDTVTAPEAEDSEAGATALPPDAPVQAEDAEPPLPDDPGEASYVRGYRLWRDGRYEEARAQLRQTVEQYPGHRFESYARNLLGRAYLDDDKPANATEVFVRNYQELPNGERAADSLFFLGVALTQLNYRDRACLAFDELEDVYGDNLRSTIREQVPAAREAAGCS